MATIEEGSVFEYCEALFDDLENKDGGYHPRIHDDEVFKQASLKFGIKVDDVDRIYHAYKQVAANKEVDKINRLPKPIRQKVMMRKMQNIILNNKDFPFYKTEGEPTEPVSSALKIFEEEYRDVIEKIAQAGWTLPLSLRIQRLEEIKKTVDNLNDLDNVFIDFYKNENFSLMCKHIRLAFDNDGQKQVLEECINIYHQGLFSACITALIPVFEGFISSFGDDQKDVRIKRICRYHADEAKKKGQMLKSLCWLSMYEFSNILFEKSDFSKSEPASVNRHWIIHGRTSRIGIQADCLRVFNAISTLACIKRFQ